MYHCTNYKNVLSLTCDLIRPGGTLTMFPRNLKALVRIILLGVLLITFTSPAVSDVSALNSNSVSNAQLNYAIVFVSRKIPNNGSCLYGSYRNRFHARGRTL